MFKSLFNIEGLGLSDAELMPLVLNGPDIARNIELFVSERSPHPFALNCLAFSAVAYLSKTTEGLANYVAHSWDLADNFEYLPPTEDGSFFNRGNIQGMVFTSPRNVIISFRGTDAAEIAPGLADVPITVKESFTESVGDWVNNILGIKSCHDRSTN